ncbi:MAG: hypothetical protein FJX76_15040 [Armatimonadetes bacterium]|nr:hypothetical protein [Armatimonadota bacterium]
MRRGAALALVLAAAALLLVAGLAMATISIFNLNIARQYLQATRSRLIAEAAVAQLAAEISAGSARGRSAGLNLDSMSPSDLGLRERYRQAPAVPDLEGAGDVEVALHFDDGPYFSVDNASGEYPAAGWRDVGRDTRSVPPFCVDAVIGVRVSGEWRRYEAVLARRWPFAAYATGGHVVLSASPVGGRPTRVSGSVATLNTIPGIAALDLSGVPPPPGAGEEETTADMLARIAGWEQLSCNLRASAPVTVGAPMSYFPAAGVSIVDSGQAVLSYEVEAPLPGSVARTVPNPGNVLDGNVALPPAERADLLVSVASGNEFRGKIEAEGTLRALTEERNPVADVRLSTSRESFTGLTPLPPPADIPQALAVGAGALLHTTIRLSPEGVEGITAERGATRFWLDGGGNRAVQPLSRDKYRVYESRARLSLKDCMLYVDGDLDLSAALANRNAVGIEGDNATLVVKGTLVLSGGRLDSRDQGMVIFADRVIMRASGDFRGLVIARRSLTVLPSDEGTLRIQGAVMCGDDLILRSTEVVYDPAYLKGVHNYGDVVVTAWLDLPR